MGHRPGRTWAGWIGGLAASLLLAACEAGTPVVQEVPRPTVIVITASGPYFEDFSAPGDWLVGASSRSSGSVESGVYRMLTLEPEMIAWTHESRRFANGIYEVDATLISGPEASAYGLLLLASSDLTTFVYAIITADGRYDVGICRSACAEQQSLIEGFTLGNTINVGLGQVNRLRVEYSSGTLTFLVNGGALSRLQGLEFIEGLVGLYGESSSFGGFEAHFDNLSITEQ